MNLSPLIEELQKPEYADLSDEAVLEAINAKRVVVREPVENWQIKKAACIAGYWATFVIAAERTDIPIEARGLAINVLAWVGDPSGGIVTTDMDLTEVQGMLAGIVQAGFVTSEQAAALDALANVSKPWTETVSLPEIGPGLLANARLVSASATEIETPEETDSDA